jgi:putative intracellular protease/amidase
MRKLVTVRKIDSVKTVDDYEVLVIDGVEVTEYHSPRDTFHAGEYCVFVESGVALPAAPGRPWTPTARTGHAEIYPTSAFPEIIEEMMMLAHDHDGFTTEDYLQIRETDFASRLGVTEAG